MNPQSGAKTLTPLEIKNKDFKRMLWGYSPQEVIQFLDLTAKAWEKVQRQEKELLDKIHSLNEELLRWKGREGELVKMKERANFEADGIRQQANDDAARIFSEVEQRAIAIRQKTEEWLAEVIEQIEATERQKLSFVTAFRTALESHYEILKHEEAQTEPLGSRLSQFLKETMGQGSMLPS